MEHKHFDSDDSISGTGFGGPIVDVRPQGVQWHPSLTVPFGTGHFSTAQPPRTDDFHALSTEPHGGGDPALHGPSESYSPFNLHSHIFGDQLGIHFWFSDFLNVNQNFLAHTTFELFLKLFNLRALFSDNDTGTSRKDSKSDPPGRPFNFYFRNAGMMKFFFDKLTNLIVLKDVVRIFFAGKPAGFPGFYDPQPQ